MSGWAPAFEGRFRVERAGNGSWLCLDDGGYSKGRAKMRKMPEIRPFSAMVLHWLWESCQGLGKYAKPWPWRAWANREAQFIGQSGAFLDAVERASRAAPLRRPVLVIGAGHRQGADRRASAPPLLALGRAFGDAQLRGHARDADRGGIVRP
jgi:hypothetical protein